MAHTPGEWRFRQATGALYATISAGGKMLAIFRKPISDEDGRLMAAAPDLLASLKWAVRQIELLEGDFCEPNARASQRLIDARAAIAKATTT